MDTINAGPIGDYERARLTKAPWREISRASIEEVLDSMDGALMPWQGLQKHRIAIGSEKLAVPIIMARPDVQEVVRARKQAALPPSVSIDDPHVLLRDSILGIQELARLSDDDKVRLSALSKMMDYAVRQIERAEASRDDGSSEINERITEFLRAASKR